MKRDRYKEQFDTCAHCGHIKAAHRIGDDRCPLVSKKGYNVSFWGSKTTFKLKESMSTKKEDPKPRCVIESDKVPTDWYDGQEGRTVREWGQREYDSGRKTGIGEGRLEAYNHLLACASALFREGNDEEAKKVRILAYEIRNLK